MWVCCQISSYIHSMNASIRKKKKDFKSVYQLSPLETGKRKVNPRQEESK